MQEGIEKVSGALVGQRFPHPAPARSRPRILPVFTPRAGCPGRCLFCAQEAQSGQASLCLEDHLARLRATLEAATRGPLEVAFYGGTFTALPDLWMERFLETAARYRDRGIVAGVRCSTRPDAVTPALLSRLAGLGLDSVELGVQTFQDAVLAAAARGHTGQAVSDACRSVRQAGLGLTLQLLPGLPGHTPELLRDDTARCLEARPDAIRLHPCLVLAGTGLESLWRAGGYEPWTLEATVAALGETVLALWRGNVAVTRIGLAPEPSLEEAVLAGPRHPALGTMVRARALLAFLKERLAGRKAKALAVPQRLSGEFWGHGRELAPYYARLGLGPENVVFTDDDLFTLDV